ncbi:hypothetical protein [Leptolyngbya sp. PCC 6406]|uniref:hypothetical protein n=1 Tax=Leptolyngbya sp. PCC 6406 TaxID=1173264 RepID=UPI0002ABAEAF|nr:hypothetical protein [Leptolyngbya sp. PCC 6406]
MQVEELKQKLDALSAEHLQQVATFITLLELRQHRTISPTPLWHRLSYIERVKELKEWLANLPHGQGQSLPDSAFDRASIYD